MRLHLRLLLGSPANTSLFPAQHCHWSDMFTGRLRSEIPPALVRTRYCFPAGTETLSDAPHTCVLWRVLLTPQLKTRHAKHLPCVLTGDRSPHGQASDGRRCCFKQAFPGSLFSYCISSCCDHPLLCPRNLLPLDLSLHIEDLVLRTLSEACNLLGLLCLSLSLLSVVILHSGSNF